ncbi:MAG: transporter [Deltaproteobacteria bacterium HGW-Deltaproteobacteria-15]|jgi:putative tricarboxylic transport membrane protein|nr:MAG: transporter [Deltaproteobacteria bacterium HGW-Deltaproteobacteria-15]
MVHELLYGFGVALQLPNLLACFIGVLVGTLIGVLPGIGPVGAMSILLPITFGLSPVAAIIMLAGIYYGSMYGGSTTSILVNIPGEAASVVTCLDGYQMARKGRAGPALGIAAFGSFIAGTIGLLGLMLMANPLASFAVRFGPAEYFSLMCLGLSVLLYLTHGSILKGLVMAGAGLFLSLIGQDIVTGKVRFTFGFFGLQDGVGLVPMVMGLFGISEVLLNLEQPAERTVLSTKIRHLLPSREDWAAAAKPIGRGSLLGFFLGILPGGGAVISSFVSYALEKRFSRHPERFGEGAIEGVAGPEAANNAASSGAFIPLFSLGIPANVVMALLLGALMIHGLRPGPLMITERPEIFWGTVASMYVGNVLLLILNLPLIGLWVRILKIPYRILFPLILLFCLIGVYTINGNVFDIFVMILFGIVGYGLRKAEYEPAPLVLAFVLGPMLEQNLRQALILSDGSARVFFTHPISAACLSISLFLVISGILPEIRRRRRMRRENAVPTSSPKS